MTSPDDARLRSLLDASFDALCAHAVRDFVDPDAALDALDAVALPARVRYWNERLWIPLRTRVLTRMGTSSATVGDALPDAMRARMLARAGGPAPLPRKVVDELIGSDKVREAVRATLFETLSSFVQKAASTLTEKGGAAAPSGGLRGALGFGAKMAGSMLGGLGEGIQTQLQDRVKDFVDGAVATAQQRLSERLRSDETAKALGKRRAKFVDGVFRSAESDAAKRAATAPWKDIDEDTPEVLAHNLARPDVRAALRDEVGAIRDALGDDTVGDVLDAMGLRDHLRARWVTLGTPIAKALLDRESP